MRQASERQVQGESWSSLSEPWCGNGITRSDAAKSRSAKLEPKFVGPFKVLRKESPTVCRLGTLRGEEAGAVHVQDLRAFF
ncbi:hypothetical protein J437_LFUL014276 [Ladona fulva]|uniref:Uncharacterized protein n=1 Tax=Ladona fulva TaxID=123851 RepID=A0A8K0KHF9_LADFU|nr:hypothetical protein J437_LFUL014276 [Ladona fulva]